MTVADFTVWLHFDANWDAVVRFVLVDPFWDWYLDTFVFWYLVCFDTFGFWYLVCFLADSFDEEDVIVVNENVPSLAPMTKQNLTSFVVIFNAENL